MKMNPQQCKQLSVGTKIFATFVGNMAIREPVRGISQFTDMFQQWLDQEGVMFYEMSEGQG